MLIHQIYGGQSMPQKKQNKKNKQNKQNKNNDRVYCIFYRTKKCNKCMLCEEIEKPNFNRRFEEGKINRPMNRNDNDKNVSA